MTRPRLQDLEKFLVTEVLPHERTDEEQLYPIVTRLVGGRDPVGPMRLAHSEIAHLVYVLTRVMEDMGPDGPDEEDARELRRILYGLHAVLTLHFSQEDEGYLSLAQDRTPAT